MFHWSSFVQITLIGCVIGAIMYIATRWGRLNRNGQYDPETVKSFAWKIGLGFALFAPMLYLLMLGGGPSRT